LRNGNGLALGMMAHSPEIPAINSGAIAMHLANLNALTAVVTAMNFAGCALGLIG
jgi:hypothetical protein